jgi:hypothetical protein
MNAITFSISNNTSVLRVIFFTILSLNIFYSQAYASSSQDLKNATDAACDKIRICLKKQIPKREDVSPKMWTTIDKLVKQSCNSLYKMNDLMSDDKFVTPLTQCYEAMAKQDCEAIKNRHEPQECKKLQEISKL